MGDIRNRFANMVPLVIIKGRTLVKRPTLHLKRAVERESVIVFARNGAPGIDANLDPFMVMLETALRMEIRP